MSKMTLSQIKNAIIDASRTPLGNGQMGLPIMIESGPGIGKTSIVTEAANEIEFGLVDLKASTKLPEDIAGQQFYAGEGRIELAPPPFYRRLCELSQKHKGVILFLDEFTCNTAAVQAAALTIPLERTVGGMPLPANTLVIGALNPPEQAAGGHDIAEPHLSRFIWLDVDIESMEAVDEWCAWARGAVGVRPESYSDAQWDAWQYGWSRARGLVTSFVRNTARMLYKRPEAGMRGHPTPRSWETVMRILARSPLLSGTEDKATLGLIAGAVGTATANTFERFICDLGIPDVLEWMKGKVQWTPNAARRDQTWAVFESASNMLIATARNGRMKEASDLSKVLWDTVTTHWDQHAMAMAPSVTVLRKAAIGVATQNGIRALAKIQPLVDAERRLNGGMN